MANSPDAYNPIAPPALTTTALTTVFIALVVLGILFICLCCGDRTDTRHEQRNSVVQLQQPGVNSADDGNVDDKKGLDLVVIHAFPALVYSNVKHHRKSSSELECAICLVEFEDDSILRLLTVCLHVFHRDCIDQWLYSHKSCPICRGNLDLLPEEIQMKFSECCENNMSDIYMGSQDTVIDIDVEDDEEKCITTGSFRRIAPASSTVTSVKLPRWHSTGHSIVEQKYTLRLPDNVRIDLLRGQSDAYPASVYACDCLGSSEVSGSIDTEHEPCLSSVASTC